MSLRPLMLSLPDFLPGRVMLRVGSSRDYRALERFHYRAKRPATWAAVIAIDHLQLAADAPRNAAGRVVGVGVLSWPTAVSKPRQEVFALNVADYGEQLRFANAHVRTISRVIVHPQFRGLGLARLLVEGLCAICPTRYVEARAAMGGAHPMFERAGLRRRDCGEGAAYFWKEL